MLRRRALAGLAYLVLPCLLCCLLFMSGESGARPPDSARVRAGLLAAQKRDGSLRELAVTYDDMHGLHGGLTLTIHGDGRVEHRAVRAKVGKVRREVSQQDLQQLVALLIELAAWEQRVPERTPVPDESRAHLDITFGEHRSSIWEWYNDLAGNHRMVRVRELMTKIAMR